MENGAKFLEVVLKSGMSFSVKGESINDVPSNLYQRTQWMAFELTTGKIVQIWGEEIAVIYEREFVSDPVVAD